MFQTLKTNNISLGENVHPTTHARIKDESNEEQEDVNAGQKGEQVHAEVNMLRTSIMGALDGLNDQRERGSLGSLGPLQHHTCSPKADSGTGAMLENYKTPCSATLLYQVGCRVELAFCA